MNDKELLKLLGLKDKTISINIDTDIQKQVKYIVDKYLEEKKKEDTQKREEFYKELSEKVEDTMKYIRNCYVWYGKTY